MLVSSQKQRKRMVYSNFPRVLYSRVLGTSMGFFGGPTDTVGDSFHVFVHPLSKLCISDAHLRVREKRGYRYSIMYV